MEIFSKLGDIIEMIMQSLEVYGPLLGCLLILVESIIPILPLCVFITMVFEAYGVLLGFLVSWIFTVFGCMISFFLFRKGFRVWFVQKVRKNDKVNKIMENVDRFKFQHLVMLTAIPFTPAFAINIAAALSDMNPKKFFSAMLLGKLFMVYFWGFVGTTLIQSLKHPHALIKVIIACLIAYTLSIIVNKKLDLD